MLLTQEVNKDCTERFGTSAAVHGDECGGCVYCASVVDLALNKGRIELTCLSMRGWPSGEGCMCVWWCFADQLRSRRAVLSARPEY
jgi:hypothetical protein